jgi:hypothetical protein
MVWGLPIAALLSLVTWLSYGDKARGTVAPFDPFGDAFPVLREPPTASDELPTAALAPSFGLAFDDPMGARLIDSGPFGSFFLVRGDADEVCLIRSTGTGDSAFTAGTCVPGPLALRQGVVLVSQDIDAERVVSGVAPFGMTTLQSPLTSQPVDVTAGAYAFTVGPDVRHNVIAYLEGPNGHVELIVPTEL